MGWIAAWCAVVWGVAGCGSTAGEPTGRDTTVSAEAPGAPGHAGAGGAGAQSASSGDTAREGDRDDRGVGAGRTGAPETGNAPCVFVSEDGGLPPMCRTGQVRWYTVSLLGRQAGYQVAATGRDGPWHTACLVVHLRMARMGVPLEMDQVYLEWADADGTLRKAAMMERSSLSAQQACGVVRDGVLTVWSPESDRPVGRHELGAEPVLSDWGRRLAWKAARRAGKTALSARVVADATLQPYAMRATWTKAAPEAGGGEPVWKVTMGLQAGNGDMRWEEVWNDAGDLVRSQMVLGGVTLLVEESDMATALAAAEPVELFDLMFSPSPRRLSPAERHGTVRYLVASPQGAAGALPESASQHVRRVGAGRWDVRVRPVAVPAVARDAVDMRPAQQWLAPTPYLDFDNPAVRSIAASISKDGSVDQVMERVVAAVRAVIAHPGWKVHWARASEVAQVRSGDCTEYAVLTAALARALGIPARVVVGKVYMELGGDTGAAVFGGHAWTQVWAGAWYDVDAALPDGFDAGHVAFAVAPDGAFGMETAADMLATIAAVTPVHGRRSQQ